MFYRSLKTIFAINDCIETGTKWFLASADGAAMRAGVQTGDRIIKVRAVELPGTWVLCFK